MMLSASSAAATAQTPQQTGDLPVFKRRHRPALDSFTYQPPEHLLNQLNSPPQLQQQQKTPPEPPMRKDSMNRASGGAGGGALLVTRHSPQNSDSTLKSFPMNSPPSSSSGGGAGVGGPSSPAVKPNSYPPPPASSTCHSRDSSSSAPAAHVTISNNDVNNQAAIKSSSYNNSSSSNRHSYINAPPAGGISFDNVRESDRRLLQTTKLYSSLSVDDTQTMGDDTVPTHVVRPLSRPHRPPQSRYVLSTARVRVLLLVLLTP